MSAPALPPLPTPEKSSAGPARPESPARDKVGDSEFDSVSRQERERLDRSRDRPADRNAETAPAKDPATEANRVAEPPGKPTVEGKAGRTVAADTTGAAATEGEPITTVLEPGVVFTFANLQDLVMPEQALQPAGPAGTGLSTALGGPAAVTPGLSQMALTGAMGAPGAREMLAGMTGKAGVAGQESPGRLLTEGMLAQLGADGGKPADAPLSAGLGRFQGALEVASQTQLINPGQKIPEAMVPLKGYATSVELPVGHAEWGDKLVGKLAWLTSQKMSVAEIHLTPPDMGPLEVRVQVQNDQANVTIHAANPAVRDQLELHSHRLRDMLNGQGLDLQNFDVADSPGRDGAETGDGDGQPSGRGPATGLDGGELDLAEAAGSLDLTWRGEVDLYA